MSRSHLTLGLLLAAGCGQPTHLQYDFGRSYVDALSAQADLGRPSVADAAYPLSGAEGIKLREIVVKESTDDESGQAENIQ